MSTGTSLNKWIEDGNLPEVPDSLKGFLSQNTEIKLLGEERDIIQLSYRSVALELKLDNLINSPYLINVLFLQGNSLRLSLSEDCFGRQTNIVLIPIQRWRDNNITLQWKSAIIIEELVHYFWGIYHEGLVKYKTFNILKRVFPELDFREMYPSLLLPIW